MPYSVYQSVALWRHAAFFTLGALALSACGGSQQFSDTMPIQIGAHEPEPEEKAPPRVEVEDNKIVIHEKIQFEVDSAVIKQESFDLLAEIASVMKDNIHIKKVLIEGHASADGDEKHNMELSQERAKSVMNHLIETDKVDAGKLSAKGFGETVPLIKSNKEDPKNRRVEFTITEQDVTTTKYEVDPTTGEQRVIEKDTETHTHDGK